jgi:hypothetical protein
MAAPLAMIRYRENSGGRTVIESKVSGTARHSWLAGIHAGRSVGDHSRSDAIRQSSDQPDLKRSDKANTAS